MIGIEIRQINWIAIAESLFEISNVTISWLGSETFFSEHSDFKVGYLERMQVMSNPTFLGGKLSEMRVTPAHC